MVGTELTAMSTRCLIPNVNRLGNIYLRTMSSSNAEPFQDEQEHAGIPHASARGERQAEAWSAQRGPRSVDAAGGSVADPLHGDEERRVRRHISLEGVDLDVPFIQHRRADRARRVIAPSHIDDELRHAVLVLHLQHVHAGARARPRLKAEI